MLIIFVTISNIDIFCPLIDEVQDRNEEYRSVIARLRTAESEDMNKSTALNSTQEQLASVTEQHSQATTRLLETEVEGPMLCYDLIEL